MKGYNLLYTTLSNKLKTIKWTSKESRACARGMKIEF